MAARFPITEPYSPIGHFARAVGGAQWKSVHLSMFTAYFDASGAPDQNVLAVAGFVAQADAWIEWEQKWLARLRASGLERFHYTELNKWDPGAKAALIDDLCEIIREHVHYKTGTVVVNETIDILSADEQERWGVNPYTLACRNVAKEVAGWAHSWGGRYPEMFFEKGDTGQSWLDRHFELTGYPRPNIRRKKNWTNPKTEIEELGLVSFDAADLFAQHLFAKERIFRRDGRITEEFARIHPALDGISGRVGTVTRDNIQFLKEGLTQEESNSPILVPSVKIKTE